MAYQTKPNSGALFNNDQKKTEAQPDRQGNALIECEAYGHHTTLRVAGWLKMGQKGRWMSLAFSKPRPKGAEDKDIPF